MAAFFVYNGSSPCFTFFSLDRKEPKDQESRIPHPGGLQPIAPGWLPCKLIPLFRLIAFLNTSFINLFLNVQGRLNGSHLGALGGQNARRRSGLS